MASTRRLAAILAADAVGYSRLMGADEEGTHERVKAHLVEFIDPKDPRASRPGRQDHRRRRGGIGGLPVPRQQFGDTLSRVVGDPREDVGTIDFLVDAVESCRLDQRVHLAAARRPPASDPAEK